MKLKNKIAKQIKKKAFFVNNLSMEEGSKPGTYSINLTIDNDSDYDLLINELKSKGYDFDVTAVNALKVKDIPSSNSLNALNKLDKEVLKDLYDQEDSELKTNIDVIKEYVKEINPAYDILKDENYITIIDENKNNVDKKIYEDVLNKVQTNLPELNAIIRNIPIKNGDDSFVLIINEKEAICKEATKWYNIELNKDEAEKLKSFLKENKVKYEASEVDNLIHFEIQLNPKMLQTVSSFIDNNIANMNKRAEEVDEFADLPTSLKEQTSRPDKFLFTDTDVKPAEGELLNKLQELDRLKSAKVALDAQLKQIEENYRKQIELAKQEGKEVENKAQTDALLNEIAKLAKATNAKVISYGDRLITLKEEVKKQPFKPTPLWKINKLLEKFGEQAKEYLDKAIDGAQNMATTSKIKQLIMWKDNRKKTSAVGDNALLNELRDLYVNMKNLYVNVAKADQVVDQVI